MPRDLEALFGTLAVFPPEHDVPLHTVLRYWHELCYMLPATAKPHLVEMQSRGYLSIDGSLQVPAAAAAAAPRAPPPAAMQTFADVRAGGGDGDGCLGGSDGAEAHARAARAKLQALLAEQTKAESRRKSGGDELLAGSGVEAGGGGGGEGAAAAAGATAAAA
eukprot:Rhum_TRINITY_DN14724_c2_g1::Rhum_TRINITY_DN14724_c2_g1_i1::g.111762::m.111762